MTLAAAQAFYNPTGGETIRYISPTDAKNAIAQMYADMSPAWVSYVPTLGGWTLGNGTLTGWYYRVGDFVSVYGSFAFGSTSSVSGTPTLTLPVDSAVTYNGNFNAKFRDNSAAAIYQAGIWLSSTTTMSFAIIGTNGLYTAPSSTTPFTWAAGDAIYFAGTYESYVV